MQCEGEGRRGRGRKQLAEPFKSEASQASWTRCCSTFSRAQHPKSLRRQLSTRTELVLGITAYFLDYSTRRFVPYCSRPANSKSLPSAFPRIMYDKR